MDGKKWVLFSIFLIGVYTISKDFSYLPKKKEHRIDLLTTLRVKEHEEEMKMEQKRKLKKLKEMEDLEQEKKDWKTLIEKSQVVELLKPKYKVKYMHRWINAHNHIAKVKKNCIKRIMKANKDYLKSSISFDLRNKITHSCQLAVQKSQEKWRRKRSKLVQLWAIKNRLKHYEKIVKLRSRYEEYMDVERKARK